MVSLCFLPLLQLTPEGCIQLTSGTFYASYKLSAGRTATYNQGDDGHVGVFGLEGLVKCVAAFVVALCKQDLPLQAGSIKRHAKLQFR